MFKKLVDDTGLPLENDRMKDGGVQMKQRSGK